MMKKNSKKEKNKKLGDRGITLIALIVTIIVLLILAGVSIAVLTGENGIINRATEAKATSEKATAKEKLQLEVIASYGVNGRPVFEDLVKNVKNHLGYTITETGFPATVTVDGQTYSIQEDGRITNAISSEYIPTVSYIVGSTASDTTDIGTSSTVDEGTTRYVIATIDLTTGTIGDVTPSTGLTFVSNNGNKYIYSITKDGNYSLNIKTNTGTDNAFVKDETISVSGYYKIANMPNLWTVASSSNTGNDWYAYKSGSTVATVNTPTLMGNMRAIKYTGEVTTSKWANAMTTDGSMWVWIPRFAYRIPANATNPDGHSNTASEIQIVFVDTSNNALNGESVTITANPADTGAATTKYLVHPAFTANAANGGGFGEISGFWFAKFEISGSTTVDNSVITSAVFQSKAGVDSLKSVSIGDFYKFARHQLYEETGTADTEDGFTSFGKSHMVKNSEWGAVAYLSQSAYGANGTKVTQNASGYTTGGSSSPSTVYSTNAEQSTTLNAYGVFDMNGGSFEYVASYVNNGHTNLTASGKGEGMVTDANKATSSKYKTVYAMGTSDSDQNNYNANSGMKGDAVWETSDSYTGTNSWFSAWSYFPYLNIPFFYRSGDWNNSYAGVFHFNYLDGLAYTNVSSRLALVP